MRHTKIKELDLVLSVAVHHTNSLTKKLPHKEPEETTRLKSMHAPSPFVVPFVCHYLKFQLKPSTKWFPPELTKS